MTNDLPKTRTELRCALPTLLPLLSTGGYAEFHITEDGCHHASAYCSCDPELFYHDIHYEVWIHDDSAYAETLLIPTTLQ